MATRRALIAALVGAAALCVAIPRHAAVRADRDREERALTRATEALHSLGVATEEATVAARRLPGNETGRPVVAVEYARPDGTTLAAADLDWPTGELLFINLPTGPRDRLPGPELTRDALIDAAADVLARTGVLNQAPQWRLAHVTGSGRVARVTWRAPDRLVTVSLNPRTGSAVGLVVLRRDPEALARTYAREYGWSG